jgi:hypothetical protein
MLIGARALQGLGAALISPAALSIISTTFAEGAERARALGVWAAAETSRRDRALFEGIEQYEGFPEVWEATGRAYATYDQAVVRGFAQPAAAKTS